MKLDIFSLDTLLYQSNMTDGINMTGAAQTSAAIAGLIKKKKMLSYLIKSRQL